MQPILIVILAQSVSAQTVYVMDHHANIVRLDPQTTLVIDTMVTCQRTMGAITFCPNGKLYGARGLELYEIDTLTGVLNLLHTFTPWTVDFPNLSVYGLSCDCADIIHTYGYLGNRPSDTLHWGTVLTYDPENDVEQNLGSTRMSGNGLDFFQGNLVTTPFYLDQLTLNVHVSLLSFDRNDILNSRQYQFSFIEGSTSPFRSTAFSSVHHKCVDSLYSFCSSIVQNETTMIKYNLGNETMSIFSLPIDRPQGATSRTSWVGSMKAIAIDSVRIFPDTAGCMPRATVVIDNPPRCIDYLYRADGPTGQMDWQKSDTMYLTPGQYTIYVTDTFRCDVVSTMIDVPGVEIASVRVLQVTATTCLEDNGIVRISSSIPVGQSLEFSIDGTMFSSDSVFTDLAADTYWLYSRNQDGCLDSISFIIEELPLPDFSFETGDAHCRPAGRIALLHDGAITSWSTDATNWQIDTLPFSNLDSGIYHITVRDSHGCEQVTDVLIDRLPPASYALDSVPATCHSGGIITIQADDSSLQWRVDDGAFLSAADTVFDLFARDYIVTIRDTNQCDQIDTMTVTELPGPDLFVTFEHPHCGQADGSITASSTSPTARLTISGNSFTNLFADDYVVTVTDTLDCTADELVTLVDQPGTSIDAVDIAYTACSPLANVSISSSPGSNADYGLAAMDSLQVWRSDSLFDDVSSGSYFAYLRDEHGCLDSFALQVDEVIIPKIVGVDVLIDSCRVDGATIIIDAIASTTITYTVGTTEQDHGMFTGLSAADYLLTIVDTAGCEDETTISIDWSTGLPAPQLTITADSCDRGTGALIASFQDGLPYSYALQDMSPQDSGVFTGLSPDTYILNVFDTAGCETSISFTIPAIACPPVLPSTSGLFLPTAFSPNNDGINDRWRPFYDDSKIRIDAIQLFDRWGEKVYEARPTTSWDEGWDGFFKGDKMNPGVFVAVVEYSDMNHATRQLVSTNVLLVE